MGKFLTVFLLTQIFASNVLAFNLKAFCAANDKHRKPFLKLLS